MISMIRSEIAQLGIVYGTFDCAARGVPHHKSYFGPGQFVGKFHAAKNIRVGYITSHPAIKNIADAKVHNHLGRRA